MQGNDITNMCAISILGTFQSIHLSGRINQTNSQTLYITQVLISPSDVSTSLTNWMHDET
jgi:hypothetical protein